MSVSVKTTMGGDDVDRSAVRARFLDRLAVSDITAANSPERANEVPASGRSAAHADDAKSRDDSNRLYGWRDRVETARVTAGRDRHLNSESLVTAPRPATEPEAAPPPVASGSTFHCPEWDRSMGTCCPDGTVRHDCPALRTFSPWRAHRPHLEPLARRGSA